MNIKNIIRETLIFFHLDLTKNLKYDRLTNVIMKKQIQKSSNCIDVGCHKGEILHFMLKYAPNGSHYAFEPIPYMYNELVKRYGNRATIYPYALSDKSGMTSFHLVKNAPAYSGIKERHYDISNPEIVEIDVELKSLDELIPKDKRIDFIKIDVEGAEFGVLKGGIRMLKASKPIILFECGKGASEFYGTKPSDIHDFLHKEIGLNIFTLSAYINKKSALSRDDFDDHFNTNKEYYFVAASR